LTGLITGKTGSVKPEDYAFTWIVQQVNSSGAAIGTPQLIANTKDANYTFPVSGKYVITYKAADSCLYRPGSFEEPVVIIKCDIPNVFTPDGDGTNQYFAINFAIGQSAKLKIFDRWGKEVYANENYTCSYGETAIDPANTCFTGSNLSDGTYFYTLDIPNDKKYQGYVQIVNNK
jgi:gliding motility-associated-like protein